MSQLSSKQKWSWCILMSTEESKTRLYVVIFKNAFSLAVTIMMTIKSCLQVINCLEHYSLRQYRHRKNSPDDEIFSIQRLNLSVESTHKHLLCVFPASHTLFRKSKETRGTHWKYSVDKIETSSVGILDSEIEYLARFSNAYIRGWAWPT